MSYIDTKLLPAKLPITIPYALDCLNLDGVISIATDTVYGIAAKIYNSNAINKIYNIKKRQKNKAIAVLLGNISQINDVAIDINPFVLSLAKHFWPGGLTIIVYKKPDLPPILSKLNTIGIRIPDHRHTQDLLNDSGPLATTSANLSGEPDITNGIDVYHKFKGKLDLVIDSGKTPGGIPSTVLDCTQRQPKILREGAIPSKIIFEFINKHS